MNADSAQGKMRLLVTGANSFVGKVFSRLAKNKGYQLIRVVRPDAARDEELGVANGRDDLRTVSDIGPETEWQGLLAGVDAVVHLAAKVHVMASGCAGLTDFRRVNVAGTERLASQAARAGVRRFVFLSTVKVNGENTGDQAFTEADTPAPQDAYALSKWEAELALKRVASETGLDVVILRSPMVYGPGVKGNFLRLLQAVQRGIPLPLASVHNRRSIIFLGNLVEAIITCMTHPQAKGKTYLVCDDDHISIAELISHIARALGRPARLWPFPAQLLRFAAMLAGKTAEADRLLNSLLVDSSKIRGELGWRPYSSLDHGLTETAKWFLSQARMNSP